MPVPPTNSTRFQTITCNLPTLPTCSLTKLQWLQYGDGVIQFYEIIATILILISTSCPCQATVQLLLYTCYICFKWRIYTIYIPYASAMNIYAIFAIYLHMYLPCYMNRAHYMHVHVRVCHKYVYVILYTRICHVYA